MDGRRGKEDGNCHLNEDYIGHSKDSPSYLARQR